MILAGDVGGTKTLLGLFTQAPERPAAIDVGEFVTLDYDGLEPMIQAFLQSRRVESRRIDAACFGVAGAITGQVARMTNVPWSVDGALIADILGFKRTSVLNDLEALAYGVTVLEPDDLATLQHGIPFPGGNIALRAVATAGVYIGGGIAPKILPALESGTFLEAFRAKEPMADLVATIPVAVILNPDAALIGAAVHGQYMSLVR